MKTVITFGTFDVFHVGHLRILQRARALGDRLVVGVSSDIFNLEKKGRLPVIPEGERMEIIQSLACVDRCFIEESMQLKREYILKYQASTLVMGEDWRGVFDNYKDICTVQYFERTDSISTTEIIERVLLR